jgi:cellulose synthase/poly-beta-1,6-N-acetylglucosamine synthase-like glycosyltransferase
MDAASICSPEALRKIVRHFGDPGIGCVAGLIKFVNRVGNLTGASQSLYWKYELALKRMESRIGALVGVDGPLYAVRRDAYENLSDDMISDLVTPLLIREKGLGVVLEPEAVALEDTTTRSSNEFGTRRRIVVRGMLGLARVARLLNVAKYGFLSIQILSHKILRWGILYACLISHSVYEAGLRGSSSFADNILCAGWSGICGCGYQISTFTRGYPILFCTC